MKSTIRKGSKNVALRRDFAHFVVHDSLSIDLLHFLQNTFVPDEHFYSTLATVKWSKVKLKVSMTILQLRLLQYILTNQLMLHNQFFKAQMLYHFGQYRARLKGSPQVW